MIASFIQNQILGMKWLDAAIGNLLNAIGLDIGGRIGGSVQFFLYDTQIATSEALRKFWAGKKAD